VTEHRASSRAGSRESELLLALALGALGALGALPLRDGRSDTIALLTWVAWLAPAAGAVFAARGRDLWRFGAAVPALWIAALAFVEARSERPLSSPAWAAAACAGLYFAGAAAGRIADAPLRCAVVLLLAMALASALPVRGGLPGEPWPPRATLVLLDLSPALLVAETAGARDAMWHRSLYGPAGIDRFARAPWNPALAGSTVLLVGCALALGAGRVRKTRAAAASP
jgi:hypothetical protein